MNANRKKQVSLLLIVIVIAGLLSIIGTAAADSPTTPVPPDSTWDGKTYAEWSAGWYQWALGLKANGIHPGTDDYKVRCNLGQDGDVWFLAGVPFDPSLNEVTVERECKETVPEGKALFFPIVNIVCSEWTGDGPDEAAYVPTCTYVVDNFVYPLSATIDGVPVDDLESYRTVSELFNVGPFPYPNLLGVPKGTEGPAATSGYYLLLPPLSEGVHDIEFSGRIFAPDYGIDWTLYTSYELTVGGDD